MPVPPYQRTRGSGLAGRVAGDVEKLSQTAGAGDVGFSQDGGGIQFKDTRAHGFWAVIESRYAPANSYGFTRVDDGDDGAYPPLTSTTLTGDGQDVPAWEVNGRTDVPTDGSVKVWMEPNKLGKGYTFCYDAGGGGGGGTIGETVAYTTSFVANIGAFTSGVYGDIVTNALTLTTLGRWEVTLNVNATIITATGTTVPADIHAKVIQSSGDTFSMETGVCHREVAGAFGHTEWASVSKLFTVTQTTVLKIQAKITAGTLSGTAVDASVQNSQANALYAIYLGT